MPLFKKSSKIPPVAENQPAGAGYGAGAYGGGGGGGAGAGFSHPTASGRPGAAYTAPMAGPSPAGMGQYGYGAGQAGPAGGGAGYGYGGPPGGGGYPGQPDRFASAKPPSDNFGKDWDRAPAAREAALEEEYGRGGGGGGGGGGAGGYGYDQSQTHAHQSQQQYEGEPRNEEDDEVEAIKQQMRFTKQESLSSTRNALRIARETEETARGTLLKLGEQSDKLANTERHLDISKAHSSRAEDNAKEIMALNRSIFRPTFTINKQAKRDAEEARILNRHVEEREEREAVRAEALRVQNRLDQELGGPGSGRFGRFGGDRFGGGGGGGGGRGKVMSEEEKRKNKLAQRSRYQFEATASDDELEDELDTNLDEIQDLAGRLNRLGKAMGTEIDEQNSRIRRLGDKTSALDTKIYAGTQRLDKIK